LAHAGDYSRAVAAGWPRRGRQRSAQSVAAEALVAAVQCLTARSDTGNVAVWILGESASFAAKTAVSLPSGRATSA
jgi:hypothetical protein